MKTAAKLLVVLCVSTLVTTSSLTGQETPSIPNQPTVYSFNCRDASLDVLLDRLQELTGKSITVDLGVQARFTLATTEKVTAAELTEIITQALTAQGLRLESLDEHTIRVRGSSNSVTHSSGGNIYANRRRERTEKQKSVQQSGPAYPPQGVGSADP